MTYYPVLLLLLNTLATITIATQPVKGDSSEGQSNPGECISDWRGLKKAYLDRQSSADVENSIFDFSSSDAIRYGVLVMFYDVGPPPNTSTSGRRECCQRGSKDCIIHFIYRFMIFRNINPPLLLTRIFHRSHIQYSSTRFSTTYEVFQLCWSPPLCNNSWLWKEKQLHDFSQQVATHICWRHHAVGECSVLSARTPHHSYSYSVCMQYYACMNIQQMLFYFFTVCLSGTGSESCR